MCIRLNRKVYAAALKMPASSNSGGGDSDMTLVIPISGHCIGVTALSRLIPGQTTISETSFVINHSRERGRHPQSGIVAVTPLPR
jgi:hypothetical protein